MIAEILAILSAAFTAMNTISIRKGLRNSNPISGLFVSTIVMTACLWVLASANLLVTRFSLFGILAFVMDGILGTALARSLMFVAVEKVGASVTTSVLASRSLFGAIFAIILLHEELTALLLLGTILVVTGIVVLSGGGHKQDWKRRDLIFPLGTSLLFGLQNVVVKIGLNEMNSPITGSTISATTALLVITAYLTFAGKKKNLMLNKASNKFFSLAGIFIVLVLLSLYGAIGIGKVVVVMPLVSTAPLFTIFFSYFLLRDIEKITLRIVIGAILTVLGATLVAL
ncbi:MAG: hypothetical protein APU95_01905 [Hadesarchaea archaeon YNP_N21]|nr:MAG: hypothetical protein APU95_01905 [Hadesarchaea archaeon YNP_N21]